MTELDSFAQSLGTDEHKEIFDYWRSVAPPGALPGRAHIDPLHLPTALLPWILLVDAVPNGKKRRYKLRLVGTGNVSRFGRDSTGKWFEEVYSGKVLDRQTAAYDKVVVSRRPHLSHNHQPIDGQEFGTYSRLLLPFASDGENVDIIMGVMVFDEPHQPREPG